MDNLGSLYISIEGDPTKLNADLAAAQALAQKAGAGISQAFTDAASKAANLTIATAGVREATSNLASAQKQLGTFAAAGNQTAIDAIKQYELELAKARAALAALQAQQAKPVATSIIATATPSRAYQTAFADISSVKAATVAVETFGNATVTAKAKTQSFIGAIPGMGVAAERFIGLIPGLGQAIIAAFPVLGAIAFAQGLYRIGTAAKELFSNFKDGVPVIQEAFRELNSGARIANDELRVTNDKLENSIAKIEHKPENGIKLALDEAILSANQLAAALDKDLKALQGLLKENKVNILQEVFGKAPTEDIENELKAFQRKVADVTAQSAIPRAEAIGGVNILSTELLTKQKEAAQIKTNTELTRLYSEELVRLNHELKTAQGAPTGAAVDAAQRIEILTVAIANLKEQADSIGHKTENANLTGKKEQLEANKPDNSAALAAIANEIAANKRLAEAKRQAVDNALALDKQASDGRIAAIENAHLRAIAAAQQDVQIAQQRAAAFKQIDQIELTEHLAMLERKAVAEGVGKTAGRASAGRIAAEGEMAAAREDARKKEIALNAAAVASAAKAEQVGVTTARESNTQLDELVRESQNLLDRNTAQLEEAQERLADIRQQANVRVAETQAKGGGELQQIQIQAQKLQLERQYGLEIGHTLAQQIQQETQLAELDAKGRDAKIAGLQAQMQIADAAQKEAAARSNAAILTGDTKEATRAGEQEVRNKEKVADIQAQIDEARAQANNADIEAQIRLDQLRNQQSIRHEIGSDVFRAGQQAPGAIGGALAKGVIDGKGIGRDIKDSLRGVGQELLGQVFKQAITQLVVKLGLAAAAQAALGAIFGTVGTTQAVATTANTVAVAANTIADTGLIASNVALIAALVANTTALVVNTAVGAIPFLAAGGSLGAGEPAVIGEKGPELFIPDAAGIVVPNGKFNVTTQAAKPVGVHLPISVDSQAAQRFPSTFPGLDPASRTLPGLPVAAGLSPNINLAMPQLGLPSQDATLNRVPAPSQRTATASDGTVIHLHGAQFHGVQNVRELMREISQYAKTSSPRFSPYSK